MSLLIATELTKSYGIQQVLRSVSVTLGPGEKVALVGRNGSGKTTLLRLLSGEEPPDSGCVGLLPRTHVGYLAQEPDLSGGATLFAAVSWAVPRIMALRHRLGEMEAESLRHFGWSRRWPPCCRAVAPGMAGAL